MSWFQNVVREVLGLFVEDGRLTIVILVWLGLIGWVTPHLQVPSAWRAVILSVGLAMILIESAWRRARRR